jgi:hypothetical protein
MHVVPAHLQGQPHQVRPMWTARQILGYLIRGRLMTRAAADERATANSIFSWSFSAYRRDQWRISSNYNVVKLLIGTGYKPSVEAVRAFVAQFAWCSVAHTAVIVDAPRAQKNPPTFIRRRKVPWRFLVREIALPHIDPCGSRHLAVSNDRLPDSVSRIAPDASNSQ